MTLCWQTARSVTDVRAHRLIQTTLPMPRLYCEVLKTGLIHSTDVYVFFWIPYWPRTLINILWPSLLANKYGGQLDLFLGVEQRTVGLSHTKPITTKQQCVLWLVSQSLSASGYRLVVTLWFIRPVCHAALAQLTVDSFSHIIWGYWLLGKPENDNNQNRGFPS